MTNRKAPLFEIAVQPYFIRVPLRDLDPVVGGLLPLARGGGTVNVLVRGFGDVANWIATVV